MSGRVGAQPDERPVPAAGFRLVDHTADTIVEAWGPDRGECLRQAALGLVSSFADLGTATADRRIRLTLEGTGEDRLVELLEEVVYRLDVDDAVPVEVEVADGDEATRVTLGLAPLAEVAPAGPAPKAITWSGLVLAPDAGDGWRCRVLVDV